MSHLRRARVAARHAVLVTMRVRSELPRLRERTSHAALRAAFEAGRDRMGFRIVHYSIRPDHTVRLVAEAKDREALARGMQGLSIRVAKALDRAWGRKGKVFADRYESRVLRTREEVGAALREALGIEPGGVNRYTSMGPGEDVTAAPRTSLLGG